MAALLPMLLLGLSANLEPGTLIVFIALLGTDRPHRNAMAFLSGWLVSLAVVFGLSYSVFHGTPPINGSTEELLVHGAEIVVALLLAWVAVHEWRRRGDAPGNRQPRSPGRLERIGPRAAFFSAMWEQPWTITIAAAMVVVRLQPGLIGTVLAFAVFAFGSTVLVGAVWTAYILDPTRAEALMHRVGEWIRTRGPRVFAIAAAVAAVAFFVDGIWGMVDR